jgi:carbamoyl-phosphate synthase/aspartate carbamoyltransferase/dihydroorotase
MPNTVPPTATLDRLHDKTRRAAASAVCDVGFFLGATRDVDATVTALAAPYACGLKIYVSETFGSLRLEDLPQLVAFFRTWPGPGPIAVHAEGLMLATCLTLAQLYGQRLHVCHVSRRSEIELIRRAKQQGWPVTCEVTPHHLWLCDDDLPRLGAQGQMKPPLATAADRAALWAHLDVIDCFATDHAPHTRAEKAASQPPPGVPGLETMLPLLLTAVAEGRLTLEDVIQRLHTNPRRIFRVPVSEQTWVDVDPTATYELPASGYQTACDWSPFAGQRVRGVIRQVTLRGQVAYRDGQILATPGRGRVLFADA